MGARVKNLYKRGVGSEDDEDVLEEEQKVVVEEEEEVEEVDVEERHT